MKLQIYEIFLKDRPLDLEVELVDFVKIKKEIYHDHMKKLDKKNLNSFPGIKKKIQKKKEFQNEEHSFDFNTRPKVNQHQQKQYLSPIELSNCGFQNEKQKQMEQRDKIFNTPPKENQPKHQQNFYFQNLEHEKQQYLKSRIEPFRFY